MTIFLAAVCGLALRGAIQAATDGDAWMALILGVFSVLNLGAAIFHQQVKR